MLVKTIKYTDYNGVEREENFRFNLSKAELAEMELSTEGGFVEYAQKIIAAKDSGKLIELFKGMILKAYGEKSDDGKRFVKSPELSKAFSETEAYVILFMELSTNEQAAISFFNGIVPQNL